MINIIHVVQSRNLFAEEDTKGCFFYYMSSCFRFCNLTIHSYCHPLEGWTAIIIDQVCNIYGSTG